MGGLFADETMVYEADDDGVPKVVQVKQNSAASATTATSALKDVSSTAAGIPAAVSSAKLAKLKAETDLINQQNALYEAKANGAQADVTSSLDAQTALAQANLAKLNAESALAAAQKAQNISGN